MSSRHTHSVPFDSRKRQLFPENSGQLGPRLGDRLPEDLLHLLLRSPHYLDLGHTGQFPAHHSGLQQRVAGPPLLADGEVVKSFTLIGVPQRPATLADRDARPPLRSPVRALVGGGRGTGSAIPPPEPAQPGQCRCSPAQTCTPGRCRGKPARCGSYRRCPPSPRTPSPSPPPGPLVTGLQSDSTRCPCPTKPLWTSGHRSGPRAAPGAGIHCPVT